MPETRFFINEGYGWECKSCRAASDAPVVEGAPRSAADDERAEQRESLPRFFREGEAEEREARLSTRALARRRDTPRGPILLCPLCGREEVAGDWV